MSDVAEIKDVFGRGDRSPVYLSIRWPGDAIDEIARLYGQYEKGKQTPLQRVAAESAKNSGLKPRTMIDFWAQPTKLPVKVVLDKNHDGSSVTDGVLQLAGKVTGPAALHKGKLIAEGYEQEFDIDANGRFGPQVVLKSGFNHIRLVMAGKTVEQKVRLDREPTALRATLTWDTGNSDIDLYVINPQGRECSYKAKRTGDMALDVDNTRGYGPENIFVKQALSGHYTVRVQNYSGGVGTEATVYVFMGEKLRDVHKVRFTAPKQMLQVGQYRF